jgi:uncharacterized membrane protein YoaK (UPF0700 family)
LKTKIVKDIPIGVLLIVIAMFAAYAVTVLSNFPPTLNLIAIFGLCYVTNKLVSVGMDLIQGIEIKDKNDSS